VRPVICQGVDRPKHLSTRSHYFTTVESRGNIFVKCTQITECGDDVVITGRRLHDVEGVFTSLVEQTNKMGTEINKKTPLMIASRKPFHENEYVILGTYK
jgi:hypothetical protein